MHRLPPQVKLAALLALTMVVVATPGRLWPAFCGYALLLGAVAALARVRPGLLGRGLAVELPFVVSAALLPFLAEGETVQLAGMALSVPGLWAAWTVLAKATVGLTATVLLAATTELGAVLAGLERLRLPQPLVQIAVFALRYASVVTDELTRLRTAQLSRGFQPRNLRALPVLARSVAALFVRCYERGERVHLAMLSRGHTGRLPLAGRSGSATEWASAAVLPLAALTVLATATLAVPSWP